MSLISYYIDRAADYIYDAASYLFRLGANLRNIYLLGTYLTYPIWDLASFLKNVTSVLRLVNSHFDAFYHEIINSVNQLAGGGSLLYYANQLIDFITNPVAYIANWVRSIFWWIDTIYYNTFVFIYPHVVNILDSVFPYWRNLQSYILTWLGLWFYNFSLFRFNPVAWVMDLWRSGASQAVSLIQDPDGWLKERIRIHFPDIWSLILNPKDYIISHLIEGLENVAESYILRIMKIAENILNAIF